MLDDAELDQVVRLSILNLMVVLYDCGITEVHIGGVMRIMGVPDDKAQQHDDERLVLNEEFVKYVEAINTPRPVDQILH
jgi:hypothetical protein